MNDSNIHPLLRTLRWLSQYAGYPTSRLATGAEVMILFAAAAAVEETAGNARFLIQSRDGAKDAALRAHQARRALAHYKCDNSAKV